MANDLNLLANATGVVFGPLAGEQVGGSFMSCWIKASIAVTTTDGVIVGTLHLSSSNRDKGQLDCRFVLPDGRVFGQILRDPATKTFRMSDGPSDVFVMGQKRAVCSAGISNGNYALEGQPGGLTFDQGCQCMQPKCQWCLCAFCCFFCTASISACVGMYMSAKTPQEFYVNLNGGQGEQEYVIKVHAKETLIEFGGMADPQLKIDLMMLSAAKLCEVHIALERGSGM